MPRIAEKIREYTAETKLFFSIEFFPPKTEAAINNLYDRMERMGLLRPCFVSVTWGAMATSYPATLNIASAAQNLLGLESLMHLTCANTRPQQLEEALNEAREKGIENIFALRGDPIKPMLDDELHHAIDLVRFIRERHGDYFCIAVAGYPEGHEGSESYEADLRYLKAKVDAGADFVITQLFYDENVFLKFVHDCREIGIDCPIIPGIMPIHSYAHFRRSIPHCKTVPPALLEAIEKVKDNEESVKDYGIQYAVGMVKRLAKAKVRGFHFFSLNLERSITRIVDELDMVDPAVQRDLPWRKSANARRRGLEEVRPIFWANRPKSYMARTMSWDEFPNGRWGDARSPAFGEPDEHYHSRYLLETKVGTSIWGTPACFYDVAEVFLQYIRGEIRSLPWFDQPLAVESQLIRDKLIFVNQNLFFTINSQPRVNGAPSADTTVGWGPLNGYVYQKEYVEFFCSPGHLEILLEIWKDHPSVSYMAVTRSGKNNKRNVDGVNAVTWGVFPGKEIAQPTIVDPATFNVWKDEAFDLFTVPFTSAHQEVPEVIQTIYDTWYLVNMVENDFVQNDLWTVFEEAVRHPNCPLMQRQADDRRERKKSVLMRYFASEIKDMESSESDMDDAY